MKHRITTFVAIAAGLALCLTAVPSGHAQEGAKVILSGRLGKPFVNTIVDTEQGSLLKNQLGESVAAQFADSDWTLTDKGQVTVTKGGKALLAAFHWPNPEKTWFLVHARAPKMTVDGELYTFNDDPKKGWVQIFVSMLSNDGKSWAMFNINGPMTFGQPENGNGNGNGDFPGFGN
jgi:hypothetical protein